jgi:hypothetical protein
MTDKAGETPQIGYRIDPDNLPYAELRGLLRAAYEPETLYRLSENPPFQELRYRVSPKHDLDDIIDKVFSLCRTQLLWEELLDVVAKHAPRQYNRTATTMGWPLMEESTKTERDTQAQVPTSPRSAAPPEPQPALPTAYDDVEIRVTPGPGDQYLVTIHTASGADASDPMDERWTAAVLSQWLTQLEGGQTDRSTLEAIGKQLFLSLFGAHVQVLYAEARGKAAAGLRLRLRFDAPELQALPWELLWDAGPRHEFLALSGKTRITRYLPVPHGTPPLAVAPPLGVLIVTASPRDQLNLDVAAEEAAVRDALAPLEAEGLVRVGSLPHAQALAFREALRDQRPHILHFVGHGAMGSAGGALLLEDAGGLTRVLPADDLRILLQHAPSVRLAVLNGCVTAQGAVDVARFDAQRRAILGVGPELVRAGLGAVVAMQFSLSDVSARLFAQDFYQTLARLEPVDLAVVRAREALRLEIGEGSRDWATPVLFLRAPDGVIFAPPGSGRP